MVHDLAHLRERATPSWQSIEDEDPMAMVLVVNNAHGAEIFEQEVLTAAVHATIELLLSDDPAARQAIDQWLAGRIRKIVKRARNKAWDDLLSLPLAHTSTSCREARVLAFAPQRLSQMEPSLRKLQVSGLDFPKAERSSLTFSTGLEILIDAQLHLSTGKAVAQVCHAAQLFVMQADEADVWAWLNNAMAVRFEAVADLAERTHDVAVRDAGFTEVAPNTLTCTARYVR